MSFVDILVNDKNRTQLQETLTQVSQNIVKQLAEILVPAIGSEVKSLTSGVTVALGPIVVNPIEIHLKVE